jgi:hypothetical protein
LPRRRAARGAPRERRRAGRQRRLQRLAHLIGELSLSDPDFRTWWAERHVTYATSGTRTYTHPLTGPYTLDRQLLLFPEDNHILMAMTAPDPGSLEALHRLGAADAT